MFAVGHFNQFFKIKSLLGKGGFGKVYEVTIIFERVILIVYTDLQRFSI